ncbi:MAG: ABC transporter ATP-binding protein [Betaproteobacteria bacterium]
MLKLEAVTVRFGGLTAVNRVSLEVPPAGILGLVGPNGAGKTTLFNAVSGLVKPRSGSIQFGGHDISRWPQHRRARAGLGRTFQIPQPLAQLTVHENLVVAQRFGAGAVDEQKLDEILQLVGLAAKAHRDAATALSLSELKALEVAKALATRPQLLLLDEVLAGMESDSKRAFREMLQNVHERFRVGLLIIEHDIETISALCPRVVVLNFGEVIADGEPDAVFRDPRVIESYTGAVPA